MSGTLHFRNGIFKIKLTPDEEFTEFKFLTAFSTSKEDNTSTIATSTRTVQVGDNSTGAEITIDNIELPDNKEHARQQHRIVEQGKNGFYEAFFEGETNTDKFSNGSSTVAIEWLMRHGTFVANDSWSPNDMVTRSGTLKAGELIKLVDGYDGTGSYNDAKNG